MNPATVEDRIQKGRTAIALAMANGLDTSPWQKQLAALEHILAQACEVASLTLQLLAFQGWCLWQCRYPMDEVIIVARHYEVPGMPLGLPIYTQAELELLGQVNIAMSTLRLICEVKKRRGVKIIGCSQLPPQNEGATMDRKELVAHV